MIFLNFCFVLVVVECYFFDYCEFFVVVEVVRVECGWNLFLIVFEYCFCELFFDCWGLYEVVVVLVGGDVDVFSDCVDEWVLVWGCFVEVGLCVV